ncbi:MAG: hypothetical protein F6K31_20875 [Symploca sp. SIO2G7]|nr:hypothetical protein [Symploca sp. SIO2G7]
MSSQWLRQSNRADSPYRKLEDRINFAVHVGAFTAFNSGLWFFHELMPGTLLWLPKLTFLWLSLLIVHGVWIFAIASYPSSEVDKP